MKSLPSVLDLLLLLFGNSVALFASLLLPFDNQSGPVLSHVIGILVRLANEAGTQQLEELPMLTLKQCNVLPPPPQPEAEELNRLLQLDINAEPPEEEHPF